MKPKFNPFAAALVLASISLAAQNALAANGTWSADAAGNWSDTTKWTGTTIADGIDAIADFSTLDITAGRTVTIDTTSRTVGTLKFGDIGATADSAWTLASSGGASLTLGTGSAVQPVIDLGSTGIAATFAQHTLNLPLAGTKGFNLTGGNQAVFNTGSLTGVSGTATVTAGRMALQATDLGGLTAIDVKSGGHLGLWNAGTYNQNLSIAGTGYGETGFESALRVANAGATVTLGGTITLTGNATIAGRNGTTGGTNLNGIIGDSGGSNVLTFGTASLGNGTYALNAANSYPGGTRVAYGTVIAGNSQAFGTGSVLVDGNGATVSMNAGLTVNSPLTLKRGTASRAILNVADGSTWSGGITVDNTNVTNGNYATIQAGGLAATSPSIVSGAIGASVLGTPSAASPTLVFRTTDRFGKVTGPVSLATGYVSLLDSSKWEFSNAANSWGTLDIAHAGAVVTVGAANTLPASGAVTSTVAGTLQLNNQAATTAYSQTIAGLSGNVKVDLLAGAGSATLTLNTAAAQSSSGVISGAISLVKSGAATQTLSGANTYTGSTTINGGALVFGATGELPAGGNLTVSSATLDLRKGTAVRTQAVNNLTLANATLDFGLTTDADRIDATSVTASGTNILKLHGRLEPGTYNLITNLATLPGTFTLDSSDAATAFTTYSGAKVGNNYVLTVTGESTPFTIYWRGDVNSVWNGSATGPNSNWATDATGTTDTKQIPGALTDVFFSATNAANTNTTLGKDTSIYSLTFESGTATVGGANSLSIAGTQSASGNGLNVLSGANATLNTGSIVSSSPTAVQTGGTLTVNGGGLGAGPLTVDGTLNANMDLTTGSLSGSGSISRTVAGTTALTSSGATNSTFAGSIASGSGTVSLIKTGAGSLTLSGANTYTGGTTVSNPGDTSGIIVASASALGTGPVLVNGGQNFNFSVSLNTGLTVTNALTLKRGVGGSNRAILGLAASSTWAGNITLDNTSINGLAVINGGGTTAATASIVSGNIGFSALGTGNSLALRGQGVFGKISGSVSLSTGTVQLLDNSRYEFSNASNTWGTLDISNVGAVVTVGAANTLSPTGVVTSTVAAPGPGGTLQLNNQAGTTAYSQTIAGLSGNVRVGLATGAATLTLNTAANQTTTGVISGAISLVKTGTAIQTLSGVNTYTGDTTVNGGTLILPDNAQLKFVPGANGVSNQVKGTGAVELSGDFNIDLSAANLTNGNSWTLVDVGTLSEAFLSTFQVVGFTETANVHKLVDGAKTWTFTEATGVLSLSMGGGYDAWAASKGLTGIDAAFDADPDNDGLKNGLEFVLGGEPNPANAGSNSAALLPTVSQTGGNLTFTFKRKDLSETGVALKFQWSTDLSFPSPANDVLVGASDSTTNTIGVDVTEDSPDADTDTIVITVPAAKAAGGKLFGRLNAVKVP